MKNKLFFLIGIVLVISMTTVMASEINVPVIVDIQNGTLNITGDNLAYSLNLSSLYNLTENQTNVSLKTVQIIKLTGSNAETLEDVLRQMILSCNESRSYIDQYINCNLTSQILNQTESSLASCQFDKTVCSNVLDSWKTSAAPYAITNPSEIKVKIDSAKNSLIWLVIVVGIVVGLVVYYVLTKRGKSRRPEDISTSDYD